MRTISNKGYAKFAIALLIFAMCVTAFIITPFCNSTANAYGVSNATPSMLKPRYTADEIRAIPGSNSSYPRKTFEFFADSGTKGYDGVGNLSGIFFTGNSSYTHGARYAPDYYDLSTGNGTSKAGGLSVNDFFNGDFSQTVSLREMNNYFGAGYGENSHASNTQGATIDTTYGDTSMSFFANGASPWFAGQSNNQLWDWRRGFGYFYTYVKVPQEVANIASVSVSANLNGQSVTWYDNDHRYVLVLEMSVGTLRTDTATGNLLIGAGDLAVESGKSSQYVSPDNQTNVSDSSIVRTTESKELNGSQWIRIGATMYSCRNDGSFTGSTKGGGLPGSGQANWDHGMALANVKLNFTCNKPLAGNMNISPSATGFSNTDKTGSMTSYYKNSNLTSDYTITLLRQSNNGSYAVVNADEAVVERITSSEVVDKHKYVYNHTFIFHKNGNYRLQIVHNRNTSDKTVKDFVVSNIDQNAPSDLTTDVGKDSWVSSANVNINISNIVDNPDRYGNGSSGIDKLYFKFGLIEDGIVYDETDPNFLQTVNGLSDSFEIIANNAMAFTLSLNSFNSFSEYGRFMLAITVRDKAGNISKPIIRYINYENDADVTFNMATYFKKNSYGWIVNDYITIVLSDVPRFHFSPKFELHNEYGKLEGAQFDFQYATFAMNLRDSEGNLLTDQDGRAILVPAKSYYVSFPASALITGIKVDFNDSLYIFGGNGLKGYKKYDDKPIMLQVDTIAPLSNLLATDNALNVQTDYWYTWNSLDYFLSADNTSNGIQFILYTEKEGRDLNYINGSYKFFYSVTGPTGSFSPLATVIGTFDGMEVIKLSVPLNNSNANNITIKILDQAGNEFYKEYQNIKFDSTKYTVSGVNISENCVGEFRISTSDTDNVGTLVNVNYLLTTPLYRGQRLWFTPVCDVATNEYYRTVLGNEQGTLTQVVDETHGRLIGIGDWAPNNAPIDTFTINMYFYKYIDVNIYIDGFAPNNALSNNMGAVSEFEYNGNIRPLYAYNAATNIEIDDSYITSPFFGTNPQSTVKNVIADDGFYTIPIEVNDTVNLIKTKNNTAFYVKITPKSVIANITGDYGFVDEGGKKYLSKQYGEAFAQLSIDYLSQVYESDRAYVEMIFGVRHNGAIITDLESLGIGNYDMVFYSNRSHQQIDASVNYTFILQYKGQAIELALKIVARDVNIILNGVDFLTATGNINTIEKYYGEDFDLGSIAITLDTRDFQFDIGRVYFGGTLKALAADGQYVKYNTPVGNYGFSTEGLILYNADGSVNNNVNLIVSNLYRAYIAPKTLTFKLSDQISGMEYGSALPDFTNRSYWSFPEGIVYGDVADDIYQFIQCSKPANMTDVGSYDLVYSLSPDNNITNYRIVFQDKYIFKINKKTIFIDLDLNKSLLSKKYDGLPVNINGTTGMVTLEGKQIFFPNLTTINGFVDPADKALYDFSNAGNAFTMSGNIVNVGEYAINAISDYDSKITIQSGATRNYTFVPRTDLKFSITQKRITATITSFTDKNGTSHNDFNLLHRPYQSGFANGMQLLGVNFSLDDLTLSPMDFAVYINGISAVDFMMDLNNPVGRYNIEIKAKQKDADGNFLNNYLVEHNVVYFYIDKSLYNFDATEKINELFGNGVEYTASKFVYNQPITVVVDADTTITFYIYTLTDYIDVTPTGEKYKLYINQDTAAISNSNFSGVKFAKTEYDFVINKKVVTYLDFAGYSFSKDYDASTAYSGTFRFKLLANDDISFTAAGNTSSANAARYNQTNLSFTFSGAKVGNYDFSAVSVLACTVDIKKLNIDVIYNGKSSFPASDAAGNTPALNASDFVFNGVLNNDRPTLELLNNAGVHVNITTSFIDWFPTTAANTQEGTLRIVVADTENYTGSIKLSVVIDMNSAGEAAITCTTDISNIVYTGASVTIDFSVAGSYAYSTKYYKGNSVATGELLANNPVDAGDYIVVAEVRTSGVYGRKEVFFTVKPIEYDLASLISRTQSLTKDFDGTTNIPLNLTSNGNLATITGQYVAIDLKGNFNSAGIGSNKAVNYRGTLITNNNTNLNNYKLLNSTGTLSETGRIDKKGTNNPDRALKIVLDVDANRNLIFGNILTYTIEESGLINGYPANITGTLSYTKDVASNVSVDISGLSSEFYVIATADNVINIVPRPVIVKSDNVQFSFGVLGKDIVLNAEFEGVLDSDLDAFYAIRSQVLTFTKPSGYNPESPLAIGTYKLIGSDNDYSQTPVIKNYAFDFTSDQLGSLLIVGVKVKATFNNANFEFNYSDFLTQYQGTEDQFKEFLKGKLVFNNIINGEVVSVDTTDMFVYFVEIVNGIESEVSSLTTANVGILLPRVRYADTAIRSVEIVEYDVNSTKINIVPKPIELQFNESYFIDRLHTEIYGYNLTKSIFANEVLTIKTAGLQGFIKGYVGLKNASVNQHGLYDAGIYSFDFRDVWFSLTENGTFRNNYVITLPIDDHHIRVEQKEVILNVFAYGTNDAVTKEYKDNDPEEGIFTFVVNTGLNIPCDFTPNSFQREQGEDVGSYGYLVKGKLLDGNFKLATNGEYVKVNNKFVITKRLLQVNTMDYAKEKIFDNSANMEFTYGVTSLNSYDNPLDYVISAAAGLGDVNIGQNKSVDFRLALNTASKANYAFVLPSGGVVDKNNVVVNAVITDGDVVIEGAVATVLPATININLDLLKGDIAMDYNNNTELYSYSFTGQQLNTSIASIDSPALKNYIERLELVAHFNDKNANNNLTVTASVSIKTTITNFTDNVIVMVNDEAIALTPDATSTNYQYNKSYMNCVINPRIVTATSDSYVFKYYDKTTGMNTEGKIENPDGSIEFADKSKLKVSPVIYGNDVVKLVIDFDRITFLSDGNAINHCEVRVPVSLTADTNVNYCLEGNQKTGSIIVNGEIAKRVVSIKINDNFQTDISKVYDGTTSVKVDLTADDYTIVGIIEADKGSVGIKVKGTETDPGAEFVDAWAGVNKAVVLKDADLVDLDGKNLCRNYIFDENNKNIEGLTGTIHKRPVMIDSDNILIYNTSYIGSEGKKYSVNVIDYKKPENDLKGVDVYMPIMDADLIKGTGILDKDAKYKLKVDITLMLDDKLSNQQQSIYRDVNGRYGFRSTYAGVDSVENANAQKAADSYEIGNVKSTLFGSESKGRENLKAGRNVNSSLAGTIKSQTYIYPFEIRYDDIKFENLDKEYDGTTGLNGRIFATVSRVGDMYNFLLNELKGFEVIAGEYNNASVGKQQIPILEIDKTIRTAALKEKWYKLEEGFDTFFYNVPAEILPRTLEVKATGKDKVYDGTVNAVEGVNYTLSYRTINNEVVKVLCDARYMYPYVNQTADSVTLTLSNFRFDETNYGTDYKNYKIVVKDNQTVSTKITITGLNITKAPLYVNIGDLTLTYGELLPNINVNNYIKDIRFTGLVNGEAVPNEFIDSIILSYIKGYEQGSLLNCNVNAIYNESTGEYEFVLIVKNNAITAKFNSEFLLNYEPILKNGNIIVTPKTIDIEVDSKALLSSEYGKKINNVYDALIFIHDGQLVNPNDILPYIIAMNLPTSNSAVGEYAFELKLRESSGYKNYLINLDAFNALGKKYTITPATIRYECEYDSHTFEYSGNDYATQVLNRYIIDIYDNSDYVKVIKTLVRKEYNGTYTEVKLKDISSNVNDYNNLYIKVVVQKLVNNVWVDNPNYDAKSDKPFMISNVDVKITPKIIELNMKTYSQTYNGLEHKYTNSYSTISQDDIESGKIGIDILDGDGNKVNQVVEVETIKGYYRVVAYSKDKNYFIKSMFPINDNELSDAEKENYQYGFTVAKMYIEKIKISAEIGDNSFEATSDTEYVRSTMKSRIKLLTTKLDSSNFNIEFPNGRPDFTEVGLTQFKIVLVGTDADGKDVSNYAIDSRTLYGTIIIVDKAVENKDNNLVNCVIVNKDGSNIDPNLVMAGLYYKIGTSSDKKFYVDDAFYANNSFIKNTYSMVFAGFKEDINNINSANIKLDKPVQVKLRINGDDVKHNLYLLDENGICTKISNVSYVTENGATYAVFDTQKLGWFIFADEGVNTLNIVMYTAIGLVSAVMLALLIVLGVKLLKNPNKSKK